MLGYDVLELLYLNCKIHAPRVKSSGHNGGGDTYGHIVLMHIMLKIFSTLAHLLEKITYVNKEVLY